ncbi:MAG: LEPR-XLL domain-containing protein, partial [Nitrospirota bacterium]|nr:LEPR-XLL domain-containing protein [Nitrospirota bacterium]
MNLAQWFYNKQAIKQSKLKSRFLKKRKSRHKALPNRNQFLFEQLEDRILLSADPLAEIVEPIEPSIVLEESAFVSEQEDAIANAQNESISALTEGPLLTIADATVLESNSSFSPNLEFVVTLSEAAATDVMVSYQTLNGTAKEGVDFAQTANTLTIAAGDTSGLIAITTFGETEVEADEYLILELTNVQGAQFAESALRARAFGTILDNDGGGNKLGLFVDDAQVVETDAGTHDAIFRVHLSQDPGSTVALNYTTVDGSASAGTDYQLTAGTLNFTSGGSLTQEVRVPIFGDLVGETSEHFSLVVTPTAAIANGAAGAAGLGTILDDDSGGGLLPVLSLAEAEVLESNTSFSPTMEFVLTLSEAATADVTLTYQTLNGTAKEESDFDQVAGTFTIVAGQTSGRLTFTTFGLSEVEPDEFFLLELTNVQGAVFAGGQPSLRAVGTLLDNDGTDNKLSLFVEDVQLLETDTGTHEARFNVHLSQPSAAPITLSYTTADGSAVAGQDYQLTTGIVTFNPGETLKTVAVPVFGDLLGETSEHFSLVVTPTAAIANGAAGAAGLGTILDDDSGGGLLPVL